MIGPIAEVRFPAMLFGENHMNYDNKIKAFSLLVLFSLAFTGMASAQGDYVELTETLDVEKVWGGENIDIADEDRQLEVEVVKDEDVLRFNGDSSEIDGSSGETVTFDKDADGTADYQVQYKSGSWKISYVQDGSWTEFTSLPDGFDGSMSSGEFSVEVPVSELSTDGRDYLFGVQVGSENGQLLFPDGDALWYNGDNYVSSEHYLEAEIDNFEPDTTKVDEDTNLGFGEVVNMVKRFFESPDNFIKDWVRDTQASEDRVDSLEERVNRLELEQRSMKDRLERVHSYNETDEPSKVELAQEMMFRNNLSEVTVTEDGQEWKCELTKGVPRGQEGTHQATCIAGN